MTGKDKKPEKYPPADKKWSSLVKSILRIIRRLDEEQMEWLKDWLVEWFKKHFFPEEEPHKKLDRLEAEHERMIASLREQEAILKDLSASPAAHSTARKKLMRYSQEIKKLDAEIGQLREILHSPVSDQDSEVKRAEQEKEQELLDETTQVIQAEQKKIDAMLADVQRIGQNIMAEYLRTYELEKKLRDQSKNPGIWSGDNPLTDAGPVQLIHKAPAKGVPEVAQQPVAQTRLIETAQKGLLEYEKAGKTAAQVVQTMSLDSQYPGPSRRFYFCSSSFASFSTLSLMIATISGYPIKGVIIQLYHLIPPLITVWMIIEFRKTTHIQKSATSRVFLLIPACTVNSFFSVNRLLPQHVAA